MSALEAITLIEETPDVTEEELLEAWQFLIDTGIVWKLQGWYGRTAASLIEEGHLFVKPVGV